MRPRRVTHGFRESGAKHVPGAGLLALLVSACTSVTPGGGPSALMTAGNAKVSVQELRTTQNLLAVQVPGTIEAAADAIAAQATDVRLRRRALLLKIELVPAFYEALFNADPLAATLDSWALSVQLVQFLETGAGKDTWAPLQSIAVDAARKVRAQIEVAAKEVSKSPEGFERAKSTVETWAKANPIQPPFSSRPSILPELARLSAGGSDVSVFQAVGDITGTVNDLAARLDIYAAYLPRAGRWQAELLMDQMTDRTEAQRALNTLESVQKLTERTNQLLSAESMRAAMDTATAEVRRERIAALASVDVQRKETLTYLTAEREAALAAVDVQRRKVMADIDAQRTALLAQLDALRKQSFSDADDVANRIIRKGAIAAALLLVLAAVLTLGVVRLAQRRKA